MALGSLISAGANLLGGLFSSNSSKKAAEQNAALQREFAQNGIQWKVEDAKKAGIHPAFALGANTASASPSYVGDSSFGTGIANAGQDLGRAINATRSSSDRVSAQVKTMNDLQLQNAALQNEQLAIQNAKLRASPNPPMPTSGDTYNLDGQSASGLRSVPFPQQMQNPSAKQNVDVGYRWEANPYFSNANDIENRYGELADMASGFINVPMDVAWNLYQAARRVKNRPIPGASYGKHFGRY